MARPTPSLCCPDLRDCVPITNQALRVQRGGGEAGSRPPPPVCVCSQSKEASAARFSEQAVDLHAVCAEARFAGNSYIASRTNSCGWKKMRHPSEGLTQPGD